MREPPIPGWKAIRSKEQVIVPAYGTKGYKIVADIEVPAWQDPESKEIFLDGEATEKIEEAKARYMGLLCPEQLKELRDHLGLTQKKISELLQIGPKSWTRWESGKERPSRSINLILCALYQGEITVDFLEKHADPRRRGMPDKWEIPSAKSKVIEFTNFAVTPSVSYEARDISA